MTPISTAEIKPMIHHFGTVKRVSFLTGALTKCGQPVLACRKPQQRNWRGVSVWCVQYSGLAVLVDPIELDGRLVPQIAYHLEPAHDQ